jgi:peptide/nickel transport system substrate-binding protein
MQNKFGLKDFVTLVILLAIGLSVWISMYQRDREWARLASIDSKMRELEQHLSRMEHTLESGAPGLIGARMGAPEPNVLSNVQSPSPAAKDESWAVSDIPITWQKPWTFANNPRGAPGARLGGEFTELFEARPAKIVPYLSTDVYGRRIIDQVCDSLAAYDPDTLELRGVLAEAWQYDPQGHWLRVRLRPRLRFSDGQPLTAEDVRWTLQEYVFNSQIEAERSRSTLDNIEEVRVIDDLTVEFRFGEPMFTNLSYTMGIYVLPKHFYSRFTAAQINQSTGLLMGSGRFRLADLDPDRQWTPGTDVVLARNEQYWGEKPALDRMRFRAVPQDVARLIAYRNKEGDMVTPSAPQFVRVTTEPDWERHHHSLNWINMRSGYSFVAWQCGPRGGTGGRLTPFHDRRVRLAMTHLLDRERMIRDIWDGLGAVAKGSNNPESPASNKQITPWPHNMDKARALLAEAGWRDRDGSGVLRNDRGDEFVFEFTHSTGSEVVERFADYLKNQCARVGIRCTIRKVDWSIFADILKSRDFDALTMAWSASAPESDPKQIWHSSSIQDQGDNFIQWANADADRIIDAIRRELDDAKRMTLWHQFEAVLHEDQPYTFVRVAPWLRLIHKDMGNVHPYRSGLDPAEFFRAGAASVAAAGGG